MVNWLIAADHSALETTIAYEQVAIEVPTSAAHRAAQDDLARRDPVELFPGALPIRSRITATAISYARSSAVSSAWSGADSSSIQTENRHAEEGNGHVLAPARRKYIAPGSYSL
jgi:hypothetical protein